MGGCLPFALLLFAGAVAIVWSQIRRIRRLEESVALLAAERSEAEAAGNRLKVVDTRLRRVEALVERLAARDAAPAAAPAAAATPAVAIPAPPPPSTPREEAGPPALTAEGVPGVPPQLTPAARPLVPGTPPAPPPAPVVPAPPAAQLPPSPQPIPVVPEMPAAPPVPSLARAAMTAAPGKAEATDRAHPPAEEAAPAERPVEPEPPSMAPAPEPEVPAETWSDRVRAGLAGEEWEAVVGGSWLNKIGVGILVIGVALLLGYSFAHMGPAGRVALGLAISLTMLGTGVWVERRERYVVFARGLIGGGWASLYFTAYAMHGLDAARVIESPLYGAVLLVAVAAGMIAHSLKYRSQAVTGLAYFLAFVALSLGGSPGFSLVALVPLAASLLMITRWFSWAPMMLAGLGLTYGTYLVAASGAPNPTVADFIRSESVLAIYWLLFEVFDLIELGKGRVSPITAALFPLNACAFLGISMLQWESITPDTVYVLFGGTGVAYVLSAIVRARLRPPSSFASESGVLDRAAVGSYEAAITVAAALMTWGSGQRFAGLQFALAVFMQAEMLFFAGRALGQWYLRLLGTLLLVVPVGLIARVALFADTTLVALGLEMRTWVPLAALVAAACYANRAALRGREVLLVERAFNAVASATVFCIAASLAPEARLGLAWFAIALVFFEVGALTRAGEFRVHAYAGIGLAIGAIFTLNVPAAPPRQWVVPAVAAMLCYLFAIRQVYGRNRAPAGERETVRTAVAVPATLLAVIVAWMLVPADDLGLTWFALAFPLYEAAARTRARDLRFHAYLLIAVALGTIMGVNVVNADAQRWPFPAAAAALSYLMAMRQVFGRNGLGIAEREAVRMAVSVPATLYAGIAIWMLVPGDYLGLTWFALAFPLYEVAARTRARDLRFHAYVLAAMGLGAVTGVNIVSAAPRRWPIPAAASVLSYLLAARQVFGRNGIDGTERLFVRRTLTVPAAALASTVFWIALPDPYFRIAWLAFAAILFEVGVNSSWSELKFESYLLAGLGIVAIGTLDAPGTGPDRLASQITLAGSAALLTGWYLRLTLRRPARLADSATEADLVGHICSGAALLFVGALLWQTAATPLVAIGWSAAALLAIVAGDALADPMLRAQGHAAMTVALARLALVNFDVEGTTAGLSDRLLTVLPIVALCYGLAHRLRRTGRPAWEAVLTRWYLWVPGLLAANLILVEFGETFAVVGWMAFAVALLVVGVRRRHDDLRLQAYILSVAAVARCWAVNFYAPPALSRLADPAVVGTAVALLCFVAQLLTPRPGRPPLTDSPVVTWLDHHARTGFSLLGTILLTVLLYHETSARVLTMAWGIEAAAILVFGFVAHERALRLSGLLLLATCVVKLFALDFRELDAMARIISFIVLGLLFVAASWVYTRYRDQLHRYL